ncbi:bifunctional pyr operon transcriptional regulator/uracil phosphoribosyltransferase PyrR [Opitutaceae bacterium]
MPNTKTLPSADLHAAIERLISAIGKRHADTASLLLLGVANGGIELARRLSAALAKRPHNIPSKVGTIDISFHRDDIGNNPIPKEYAHTVIPVDVTGATVILVDDVLFSGRTVKAALDELFDHGRPAKVELAVLVDREGRRLPIAADYTGLALPAADGEKIVVHLDPQSPSGDRVLITPAKS